MPFDKLTTNPDTQTHYLTSSFGKRRGIRKGGHPPLFSREGERGGEFWVEMIGLFKDLTTCQSRFFKNT